MSFAQGAPTQPLVLQGSNVFLYGSSTAGNAFTVQQLGAGNVASFQTSTGATGLIVNPTGLVGIGKTNPGYALDVTGDLNFTGTFRQNGTPYIGSQWTGTSTLYFVGNVGINTTSVANPLTVGGTVVATTFSGSGASLTSLPMGQASGTLAIANGGTGLTTTSQNFVFAGPTSGAGAPSFRILATGDIPTLNQNTTGSAGSLSATLVTGSGGTGLTSFTSGGLLYASSTSALASSGAYTAGQVLYGGGAGAAPGSSSGLFYDSANSRLGIGTVSPAAALDVVDQNNAGIALRQYNSTDGVVIRCYRALGTIASPTAVIADSCIVGLRAFAYNGTAFSGVSAGINLNAAETFTATAQGSYIQFLTTASTTTTYSEKMRILGNGNVGIGRTDPPYKFCVDNGSTTGVPAAFVQASGITAGQTTSFILGKANSANNSGTILWNHVGDGLATNYLGLGYWGNDNRLNITAAGNVGIGKSNPAVALDVSGEITASGSFNMTGNATRFKFNNTTTWSGDTGAGFGKLEYHVNRWYIAAGSDSGAIVQFRRGGTDVSSIDNSGNFSGTATTATNQSGGTVSATTGAFSSTVSFFGGNSGTNGFAFENLSTFARIPIRQLRFYDWNGVGDFIYLSSGCVGIRTSQTTSALEVAGRSYFWGTGLAGGGQNRFTGLEGDSVSNGRAQVVLNSSYSDLVIASSQANGTHGSTLSFVTADPSNVASYKKFVINVGNWAGYGAGGYGDRMSFGWVDAAYTNPHNYTAPENSVMCLDGRNKRVGINNIASPGYNVHVNGNDYATGRRYTSEYFSNFGTGGLYNDTYGNIFYRNDAQYGNWKIDSGNKINNWNGIRFTEHDLTLMMGATSRDCGVHMNGVGWSFYADASRNFYCPGDITAFWSDRRLKKDFVQVEDYDEILNGMTAYRFKWNALGEKVTAGAVKENDPNLSLIAQDVQAVLPNAVKVNKAGISADPLKKDDDVFDYLTIDYDKITPVLVEALKQTRKELAETRERLFALEKIVNRY